MSLKPGAIQPIHGLIVLHCKSTETNETTAALFRDLCLEVELPVPRDRIAVEIQRGVQRDVFCYNGGAKMCVHRGICVCGSHGLFVACGMAASRRM